MKKKIISGIVLVFFCVLMIPILLLVLSEFTGIGSKKDGFKVYTVYSPSKEGQDLINQYKIKCIARDVEGIAFIDIKRGETFFAYNIDHNNFYFYENVNYDKVPEEISNKYNFAINYNWIETYGKYILIAMLIICVISGLLGWRFFGRG